MLLEETTEQGCLGVIERSSRVRVQGQKIAAEGEFFEDPQGKIFALGGADEELPARGLEALQHHMYAGIDGVLRPAGGVVAQAVVVPESCAASIVVAIRHEAAPGLFGGRTDEPVERPGPGDAMGFEGLGKASENAWFRVSERAIEIEYCRSAHHHVTSRTATRKKQICIFVRGFPLLSAVKITPAGTKRTQVAAYGRHPEVQRQRGTW